MSNVVTLLVGYRLLDFSRPY